MFAAFFAFSSHSANAQNADAGDVETGLIGHWTLDDASGSQITDSSSNANHGTWIDNENTDLTEESGVGKIRSSVIFDADDRITIPTIGAYNVGTTGSFSISFWFKTFDPSITFLSAGGGNQIISMGLDGGRVRFRMRDSLGNSLFFPYSCAYGCRDDGQWHLAVMVLDRVNNSAHVYIDDIEEQSFSDVSAVTGNMGATVNITTNGLSSGLELDDIRYYNRALSFDDVALLYKSFPGQVACDATNEAVMIFNHNQKIMQYCNGSDWVNVGERQSVVPTNGLVGHWTLDDTNTTALASVGANGTMTNGLNGASDSVTGKIGTAINFGVDTQLIDFGNILNMGTNDLSYSLWINPQTCASSNTGIVSNRNETAGGDGYSLRYNCTTGNLLAVLGGNAASSYVAISPTDIRGAGWQHVAVNYDRDGNMQLFLNGVSNATLSINAENGVNITTSRPLELGGSSDSGTAEFAGDIDDFRIYNRTLTPGEILAIYSAAANNGLGCTAPNGKAGEMDYNLEDGVMQYCDGENWISMGPKSAEAGVSAADLSTTAPTSGLIGHWPLNTDATDALGNSNGSLQNGAAIITSNKKFGAGAVELDGTNDHVSIPTTSNINLAGASEMSVSLWVDLDSVSGTVNSLITWESVNGGNESEPYRLNAWDAGGGQYFPSFELANASDTTIRLDAGNLNYNGWHHVVGTYDGAEMRIYVDGQLANSAAQTGVLKTPLDGALNVDLLIGSGEIPTARYTNGTIDDVRLYNRKLEPEEVLALFRASSLVAHWKMDETGSTTTAVDSSGNGYNATMLNGLSGANTTAGKTGSALRIDGTNDRMTVPYSAALHPSQITFCAWVKVNTPTGGYPAIAVTQVWPNRGYNFSIDDATGDVIWSVLDGTFHNISYNTTVTNWHHYCGTADGTTQNFYVDGNLVGTQSAGYIPMTSGTLYLASTTNNINTLNGDIDDVRIYNRILSAEEIGLLYATTGGGSIPITGCPNIGDTCDDGSVYAGLSPDGDEPIYVAAAPLPTNDWAFNDDSTNNLDSVLTNCTIGGTEDACKTGEANTASLVQIDSATTTAGTDPHIAALGCYCFGESHANAPDTNIPSVCSSFASHPIVTTYPQFDTRGLDAHGRDDWYLPSIAELDEIYANIISPTDPDNPTWQDGAGGGGTDAPNDGVLAGAYGIGRYWSSSETNSNEAWRIIFDIGSQGTNAKNVSNGRVMCVRKGSTIVGGTCSSPRGAAGEIIYNDDFNIMQYCNGSEWVALGSDYSGSAVVLSAPAGTGDCTNIGDVCPDGTIYAGVSPDGNIRMFTTPADAPGGNTYSWNDGTANYTSLGGAINCNGNPATPGCNTGQLNTSTLASLSGSGSPAPYEAAQYCYDLVAHGKNDWYLPAETELLLLRTGFLNTTLSGFDSTATGYYWASGETNGTNARRVRFGSGAGGIAAIEPKDTTYNARCVRKDAASTPADLCTLPSPPIGAVCANGSVYAGLSPDGNVKMYTTPADEGTYSWDDGTSNFIDSTLGNCGTGSASTVVQCYDGDGNTTTLAGLSGSPAPYQAAVACNDLVAHGSSDWYLPAREELDILYANYLSIGGFDAATFYWSSSETNFNNAVARRFNDGTEYNYTTKSSALSTRCVRKD